MSGLVGAGKTTVARFCVRTEGAVAVGFRSFFVARMDREGLTISRNAIDEYASSFRTKYGDEAVFSGLLKTGSRAQVVVLDGIRTAKAVRWFGNLDGIRYQGWYVDTDVVRRRTRIALRNDGLSPESLERYDELLMGGGMKEILDRYVAKNISNNGTLEELGVLVGAAMSEIRWP